MLKSFSKTLCRTPNRSPCFPKNLVINRKIIKWRVCCADKSPHLYVCDFIQLFKPQHQNFVFSLETMAPAHESKPKCHHCWMLMCEIFFWGNRQLEQALFDVSSGPKSFVCWACCDKCSQNMEIRGHNNCLAACYKQNCTQNPWSCWSGTQKSYRVYIVKLSAKETGWCPVSRGT